MKPFMRLVVPAVFMCWGSVALAQTALTSTQGAGSLDGFSIAEQDRDRDRRREGYVVGLWSGNIRLFFGGKALDENDWEPVETQGEFAILSDFGPAEWPVRLAVDLRFGASEEETFAGLDAMSTSWELNIGVRRIFETGTSVSPYLGGGLAFGGAEFELGSASESDAGVGIWLDFGVDFGVGGGVTLGFEFGFSFIPIEIVGVDTDAGGGHFGFTIGFGF
jgi:hypothetical protein